LTPNPSCRDGGTVKPDGVVDPVAAKRVGQSLNARWHVDRLIDVGGTASVYEATHSEGRRAAIKVLHPSAAASPELRRRFLREGYVANKIDHPGALAILDDDVATDGAPFLIMELLQGESLSHRLAKVGGKIPYAEALGIAGQVLDVLDAAHANGVLHRDIKPGNIFLTAAGHAKLLDFGLARIRDGVVTSVPTLSGIVMGTAGYLAPEQAKGVPEEVDVRSDLFGVGAVVFRSIVGRAVHEAPTQIDTLMAAMTDPAPSLGVALPGAPEGLVSVVDRALAFSKHDRWRSAREMQMAIRSVYASLGRRPPVHTPVGPGAGSDSAEPPPSLREDDAPSLLEEIAFGQGRAEALERERQRAREVMEAMSGGALSGK
jgi:serine/threonine-protein kinase